MASHRCWSMVCSLCRREPKAHSKTSRNHITVQECPATNKPRRYHSPKSKLNLRRNKRILSRKKKKEKRKPIRRRCLWRYYLEKVTKQYAPPARQKSNGYAQRSQPSCKYFRGKTLRRSERSIVLPAYLFGTVSCFFGAAAMKAGLCSDTQLPSQQQ